MDHDADHGQGVPLLRFALCRGLYSLFMPGHGHVVARFVVVQEGCGRFHSYESHGGMCLMIDSRTLFCIAIRLCRHSRLWTLACYLMAAV